MKKVKDMGFLVYNEDDMSVLTKTLFAKGKRCFVIPQRYDLINVGYYVVTDVLRTSEIQKLLQEYHVNGGFEEPIVKFR